MIIQEQINNTLIRTYSDKNVYIHGGFPEANYAEAVDLISANRTYTETDIPIEIEEENEDYRAIALILLGREDEI